MESHGQILWKYATAQGDVEDHANPNGSVHGIAGVCNKAGNVAALMTHPERACQEAIGSADGQWIFRSLIEHLKDAK